MAGKDARGSQGERQGDALIYSRVSSAEQADGYSVDSQFFRLRKEVPEEGFNIVAEIVDIGYERETLFRPGLAEIRERVAASEGTITAVWATRRDRFGAGPYPQIFADELARFGCSLRSLDGSGTGGEKSEFFDGLRDLMSREELRELARRSMAGKMQKARSGKIVSNGRPNYGFRHDERGNSYVVYEPEMQVVRRIFSLIGEEGLTLTATAKRLYLEGVRAPRGGQRWHHNSIRKYVLDDVYYPHTREELAGIVTSEVLSILQPGFYGIWWYGRYKKSSRRVSVEKKIVTRKAKPESDWVGVPVPDAGIPRDVADAARRRVGERGVSYSRAAGRTWQLTGGVLRCGECGRTMVTNTSRQSRLGGRAVFTYRCKGRRLLGEDRCVFSRTPQAGKLEDEVWTKVAEALSDPERLRAGAGARPLPSFASESSAEATSVAPERLLEARRAAERKRAGYLDLAASGRMPYSELDEKLAVVETEIAAADTEYRKALDVKARLQERERTVEEFAERVRGLTVEDFYSLGAGERMRVYATLGIRVLVHQDGRVVVEGIPNQDLEFWRT